jgi:hypothetical protein
VAVDGVDVLARYVDEIVGTPRDEHVPTGRAHRPGEPGEGVVELDVDGRLVRHHRRVPARRQAGAHQVAEVDRTPLAQPRFSARRVAKSRVA